MSEFSDMIRRTFKEGDDIRDAGLCVPEGVERFCDIVYGDDPVMQVLDVYRPREKAGKILPVIVSFHGGGWVYGDKNRYSFYCMSLAERGFAVVNYTYRLAPEVKFPAPLEDTNKVITFIFEQAEKYGFDTEHIFMVGDSAGAHGLGLYSCICTNPAYAANFDFKVPNGFVPTAVALNCGQYELEHDEKGNPSPLMLDYLPADRFAECEKLISVIDHVTPAFPPVFLMTASGDFLKEQALPLAAVLLKNEIPVNFRYYTEGEKPLGHVFHLNMKLPIGAVCNDDTCDFFSSFL